MNLDFHSPFCIKCLFLQITLISNISDSGTTRLMVAPNRLWLGIQGHFPFNINNFYFDINETLKTCKFGDFDEAFIETKSIWCMHLDDSTDESPQYVSLRSGGISSTNFTILDQFEPLSSDFQSFFRDQNGELCYLSKKSDCENEKNVLVSIKFKFDYELKTARWNYGIPILCSFVQSTGKL